MRISSCFFSSRLKMRILRTSVDKKRLRTVFPKDPVPPVIINTLSLNKAYAPFAVDDQITFLVFSRNWGTLALPGKSSINKIPCHSRLYNTSRNTEFEQSYWPIVPIVSHETDQLRPTRSNISRCRSKAFGIQRTIDNHRIIPDNIDCLAIHLGNQSQQIVL